MSPTKMDEKAAEHIAKARGKNDPFAKRADMAARSTNKDQAGGRFGTPWRSGDSSNSQGEGKQEKK
ncbi:hypothetical protein PG991_007446 [Apiospora marii]|uniref:SMP domain-containing protein n=1 Tax=Apiospora marii TaxID=335849 RepID=A0ABR1RTG5_9PEZI